MNIKNARRLRERLIDSDNPVGFDMGDWFSHNDEPLNFEPCVMDAVTNHACGTVACIAGHAAILSWQDKKSVKDNVRDTAASFLGLDRLSAQRLFLGMWSRKNMVDITIEEAITQLDRLILKAEAKS